MQTAALVAELHFGLSNLFVHLTIASSEITRTQIFSKRLSFNLFPSPSNTPPRRCSCSSAVQFQVSLRVRLLYAVHPVSFPADLLCFIYFPDLPQSSRPTFSPSFFHDSPLFSHFQDVTLLLRRRFLSTHNELSSHFHPDSLPPTSLSAHPNPSPRTTALGSHSCMLLCAQRKPCRFLLPTKRTFSSPH